MQVVAIFGWFFYVLFVVGTEDNVTLMKLDYYSTFAILPLTIIWVVYKVDYYSVGFALILGTFMIIQLIIKHKQITLAEKEKSKCNQSESNE